MPRTKEASQRIREEQRIKILQAARKIFARKGLAATVDDVALEASVSHGLAYRYFSSKEELIYALVKQDIPEPSAGLQSVHDMPGTPGERLNFLLSEFVKSRQHPEIYLLLGQVLSSDLAPQGLRELIHQRGLALQGVLRQLIVDGQATGEVAAGDPDQLVRAIFACLDGLIRWAVYYPDQYSEHFPDASILLRMLKP